MPLRRLLLIGCLIGACLALTSPFWYFSSDQSAPVPTEQQNAAANVSAEHTGRTGTILLDPNGALSVGAAEENAAAEPPTEEATSEDSPTAPDESAAASAAESAPPAARDKSDAPDPVTITAQAQSATTGTLTVTSKPDNSGEPAPKNPAAQAPAAAAKESTTEYQADKSALTGLEEQAPLVERVLTSESEPEVKAAEEQAPEAETDANTRALQQKIAALQAQQSSSEKKAYQEALVQRQEQVDAAIATIAQNSKPYYPPIMSRRALVVFFSVPYEDKVRSDERTQALLSQLLQQGAVGLPPRHSLEQTESHETEAEAPISAPNKAEAANLETDALTGASTIYLLNDAGDQVPHQALRFIATTLSEESGAALYEISPVTTYPQDLVTLYAQALLEHNSRRYPELTDDTPLNLEDYDTIYLCYPNWWHDIPSAVYSFLTKFDLSNKLVVPICLSAGDGAALSQSTFSHLAPNATLAPWRLNLSHQDCRDPVALGHKIRAFLVELSQNLN